METKFSNEISRLSREAWYTASQYINTSVKSLKTNKDPDFWRTVKDYRTGQNVVLMEADIELISKIQQQRIPDAQFDEYTLWVEWFTPEVMKTLLRIFPKHKNISFTKSEAQKVSKLVHQLCDQGTKDWLTIFFMSIPRMV